MNEAMQMFEKEQLDIRHAVLTLADIIEGRNNKVMGLELEAVCKRVGECAKEYLDQNLSLANADFQDRLEANEGKVFEAFGFKVKKFTPSARYVFVGETGKKLDALKKKQEKISLEIKALEKAAKATIPKGKTVGTGVKMEIPEIGENSRQFAMTKIAPKKRPAA